MMSLPDLMLPKRDYFGLSIDRIALRGVEMNHSGKIIHIGEVGFETDLFATANIPNGEQFEKALQTLREKSGFTTPYVVVSFPESFAYTRELSLPKVAISELNEAVRWHVKELFPFPEEDVYVDWKMIRDTGDMFVLAVVAVPKKIIDPIVNVIVKLGLKPLLIKPDASVVAKLVAIQSDQHAIVTEVNRTGASVTLIEGDKSVFTTVVNFSQGETPEQYLRNVRQTIDEIIAYYKQKEVLDKTESVQIILTGEVANQHWVTALPQPCAILQTPVNNPGFNKAYVNALVQVHPPLDHETINILPPHLIRVYNDERKMLFYSTVLTRTMAIIGAFTLVMALVLGLLMVEKQTTDMTVKRLTELVQSEGGNGQKLLAVNGTAKQIVALASLRRSPRIHLDTFINLLPADITINQWLYDDEKQLFTIQAVALTRDSVLNLKTILEDSDKFTNISLPLSFLESPKDISFTMTFVPK